MYQDFILPQVRKQRLLHDVTLELTYKCNLACFFCYNDLGKKGKPLSLAQYEVLLTDMARMQTMFIMLTGGEPMIHPHFFDIGRMTKELGFVVRIRTNGHSLTRRMAQRLRDEVDPYMVEVSLHGGTADSHDRQTRVPGSFDKLVKNIATSKEVGLRISVVTTPTAWNEHQINEMFDLCDSLDVPLRFQGPVAPRDNGDNEPLTIQPAEATWEIINRIQKARAGSKTVEIEKLRRGDASIMKIKEESATCSVGVAGVDIDPFGNVQACMHLQESAGNLHQHSIEEIWDNSPLFIRARNRAIEAAKQFVEIPAKQLGAPIYCLAVEENCNKPCDSGCGRHNS